MTYEAWRISYQSSEQAARAAYAECDDLRAKLEATEEDRSRFILEMGRLCAQCDALRAKLEAAEKKHDDVARQLVQSEITRREISEAYSAVTGRLSVLADENTTLRAKVESMERQKPVAWHTFDGEGGYDYRSYATKKDQMGSLISRLQRPGYDLQKEQAIQEAIVMLRQCNAQPAWGSQAVLDVTAERRRQIEVEGWTPEHDDEHSAHALAEAAACYCLSSAGKPFDYFETTWPWERWWFKASGTRRDLVKAGALILAEVERLDRAVEGEQK